MASFSLMQCSCFVPCPSKLGLTGVLARKPLWSTYNNGGSG